MDKMTEEQIAELLQTLKYIAWNLKTLAESGLVVHHKEQKKAQYPFNQVED